MAALEEVMGSIFSEKQKETFWNQLGVVIKPHVRSDKYIFIYHFIVTILALLVCTALSNHSILGVEPI